MSRAERSVTGPMRVGYAAGSRVTLQPRASSWRRWLRLSGAVPARLSSCAISRES